MQTIYIYSFLASFKEFRNFIYINFHYWARPNWATRQVDPFDFRVPFFRFRLVFKSFCLPYIYMVSVFAISIVVVYYVY